MPESAPRPWPQALAHTGLGMLLWLSALTVALLPAHTQAETARRDTVRVAIQLEPPVLDPSIAAAAPISEVVYGNVFEGLVKLSSEGEPQHSLGHSWSISPDSLDYTFQLRPGVRFHDGQPFDARVAQFALDRARGRTSLNPMKAALAAITRTEVVDPLTLRLHLSRRAGSLLQTLGSGALVMVSPHSEATNRTHPVGTGPFRFVDWRRGEAIRLARHAGYWGTPAVVTHVEFRFIGDPTAAYAAVMAGDIDLFSNFPAPENLAQFEADPRFALRVTSTEGETILALHQRQGPLSQLAVRQAIAHAIDRQALIDGAMFGYGQAIGSHFPPGHAAYVDLTSRYPLDLNRARQLLSQAGYPDGFAVTMKLPPTPYARRCGEILAAQLARIGIRVRIVNIEWAQWIDQVYSRHDFDLSIVVHAEPLDYDIYGRDDYYFGYRSPAFKALLAQLDEHSDAAQRRPILQAIQRQLSEDAVNGFLFQYPGLTVRNVHLQGLPERSVVGALDLSRIYYDDAPAGASGNTPAASSPARGGWLALAVLASLGGALLVTQALRRSSLAWLGQRLLALGLTVAVASLVVFALVQWAPGDPARYMMGLQADAQVVAQLRSQLGLDAPPIARYTRWVLGMLSGDFGQSYTYQVPVSQLMLERLQVSLPLALYALTLSTALALPIGLLAASQRGGRLDTALSLLTQLGVAIPNFWLGMLLALVFAVGLQWVPAGGFVGWQDGLLPGLRSLTLPALALAMPQAAILARVLRGALLDTLHEDYLRTARAKGVSAGRALWRHALPNALIPVLTILGMQFSFLLAGAVIIENVFFLPGLGRLLFQAVVQRDLMLVQSLVLVLALAVALVSFAVELASHAIDPRLASRRSA